MKKYEFIKNGVDDYTLKYKDKEINFKSNVNIVNSLQDSISKARMNMIKDLAKEGLSIKDLIIERKENGKTYYDNTNKEELEKAYLEKEQSKVFIEIIEKLFGMSVEDLFVDMELTSVEESTQFSEELGKILVGNFNTP
jgi:hypothetical protein